jgi:magnesium-transporting ATPase (P-type)
MVLASKRRNAMKNYQQFENINVTERITRFVVSIVVIAAAMHSPLVGSLSYALINWLAISLATVAIIGFDPVKSMYLQLKQSLVRQHQQQHRGQYA